MESEKLINIFFFSAYDGDDDEEDDYDYEEDNDDDNKPDKLIGVHPVSSRLGSSAQRKCQSLEGWERSTCQP